MDNRPMRFGEFEKKIPQMVLVSATPGEYDIVRSCQDEKTHLPPNPSCTQALTPNPSPKGRGELLNSQEIIYDQKEYNPEYITNLAKKLRKNLTTSEELLWELLRNRKFNNLKFRRQHPI
jgi:excinuclease ABC subunit B